MITRNGVEYTVETPPFRRVGTRLIWYVTYQTSQAENLRVVLGPKEKALKFIKQLKLEDTNPRAICVPFVGWAWDEPTADIYHERGIYRNVWELNPEKEGLCIRIP